MRQLKSSRIYIRMKTHNGSCVYLLIHEELYFPFFVINNAKQGKEVLLPPGSPSNGIRTAMIVHDGALIEVIEFQKKP